jgi:hypothetical protein
VRGTVKTTPKEKYISFVLIKINYDKIKLNNIIRKVEIKMKCALIYLYQIKINIFEE